MGKPSIVYQVLSKLDSLEAYGYSKRQEREGLAEVSGQEYRTTRASGIYSWDTKQTYKKHCLSMATWVRDTYGVKDLKQVTFEHVRSWLEYRQRQGDLATSLKTYGSACAKLFGVDYRAFGFEYPAVRIKDIVRGRAVTPENTRYGERHPMFRDLCRAIGPRKHKEMEQLTLEAFRFDKEGRIYVHIEKGKGGRPRNIEPLRAEWAQKAVAWAYEKAKAAGPGVRIFPSVDHSYNLHRERAWYAKAKYFELANVAGRDRSELWVRRDGEILDKIALLKVSNSIGHNRYEIVRYNYWYAF